MAIEISYPWSIDTKADKSLWPTMYLAEKQMPKFVWDTEPDPKSIARIESLVRYASGARNWVVCASHSPTAIRELYCYIAATWVYTTGLRYQIMDIPDLIRAAFDSEDGLTLMEEADLLILPYGDASHPGLQKARGSICNVLQRRKFNRMPTILDVFTPKVPVDLAAFTRQVQGPLVDRFGELSTDLFSGETCRYVTLA